MSAGALPLVGRDGPLATLRELLAGVARGQGAIVLVEGDAGLGKTRLLDEALAGVPPELTVIQGRADELEQQRPLHALRVALGLARQSSDPRRSAVAELLEGEDPASSAPVQLGHVGDRRHRAVEAVANLVHDLAVEPTVLVLDALQWADPATVLALRQLGRRTRFASLGLVLAYRPPRPGSDLDRLVAGLTADGAHRIELQPLGPDDVDELVIAGVGAAPGASLRPAIQGAAGSPLLIAELIRALEAESGIRVDEGRAELARPELPVSFVETVNREVESLPPETCELLRAAAVMGSDFTPAELGLVLDRPARDLTGAVLDARRDGLLVEAGDLLAFRHDLVRRAIYDAIPRAIRRDQHRAIAEALVEAGARPERIAWHLAASSDPPDRAVARWLRDAAVAEATAAPGVAAELLARALDFLPPDDPDRANTATELATELVWAGRTTEGAVVARGVFERGDGSSKLRSVLALALLLEGRYVEAVEQIELAAGGVDTDRTVRAQLRAEAGLARFLSGDLTGAEGDARDALDEGRSVNDEIATTLALCTLSWVLNARGDAEHALEYAEAAVVNADGSAARALARYSPHLFLGVVLAAVDRLEEAEAVLRTARDRNEAAGTLLNLPSHHACLALVMMQLGRWDDALAEAEAGLLAAADLGVSVGVVWLQALRAIVAAQQGDLATASMAADAADVVLIETGPQIGFDHHLLARGLIAEVDDPDAALTALANAWDLYEALGILTHRQSVAPELARLALSRGDTDRVAAVAQVFSDQAATTPSPGNDAWAAWMRGLAAGNTEQLLVAVQGFRTIPRPFELARAQEDAAVALAENGRVEEARPLFDEATATYEQLGAVRALARLNAALRAAGVARGKRGSRARPSRGWDSLTDTEREVVRLVAEGLTNRQVGERLFISRRTVETHVSHVFTKLDVSSRIELAALAAAR